MAPRQPQPHHHQQQPQYQPPQAHPSPARRLIRLVPYEFEPAPSEKINLAAISKEAAWKELDKLSLTAGELHINGYVVFFNETAVIADRNVVSEAKSMFHSPYQMSQLPGFSAHNSLWQVPGPLLFEGALSFPHRPSHQELLRKKEARLPELPRARSRQDEPGRTQELPLHGEIGRRRRRSEHQCEYSKCHQVLSTVTHWQGISSVCAVDIPYSLIIFQLSNFQIFALDTEMVYTTNGLEAARVTIVDRSAATVLDIFIKPSGRVVDYNTCYSGIKEGDLDNGVTLEEVR